MSEKAYIIMKNIVFIFLRLSSFFLDELSDSTTRSDGGRDEFGIRSEGEDDFSERQQSQKDISLGRTPNHLSLSTTSTLSTGSTSSQARLIQASNQPANYQPAKGSGNIFL